MPPQTKLERFKGFCQVWGRGPGGEGSKGDRTVSSTCQHTDAFFSRSVSLALAWGVGQRLRESEM